MNELELIIQDTRGRAHNGEVVLISQIQRRFHCGYLLAARAIDALVAEGVLMASQDKQLGGYVAIEQEQKS